MVRICTCCQLAVDASEGETLSAYPDAYSPWWCRECLWREEEWDAIDAVEAEEERIFDEERLGG